MKLPVISTNRVYHIGSLNTAHKGEHGSSLEANMLSVSHCPDAWEQIAQLGGRTIHRMDKKGAMFLDYYSISKNVKDEIIEWGVREHLVKQKDTWQAVFYDSESDDWRSMNCDSLRSARDELDCWTDQDLDLITPVTNFDALLGEPGIIKTKIYKGTDKLFKLLDKKANVNGDSFTYLVIAWASEHTDLDGIWWNETYDPNCYSAPRAGIFKSKELLWKIKEVDWNSVPSDDDLLLTSSKKVTEVCTNHLEYGLNN